MCAYCSYEPINSEDYNEHLIVSHPEETPTEGDGIEEQDNLRCEKCHKIKDSVRFEGSEEAYLCDLCLYNMKGGKE